MTLKITSKILNPKFRDLYINNYFLIFFQHDDSDKIKGKMKVVGDFKMIKTGIE